MRTSGAPRHRGNGRASSVPWRIFLQALLLLVIAHVLKHYFGIEIQDMRL